MWSVGPCRSVERCRVCVPFEVYFSPLEVDTSEINYLNSFVVLARDVGWCIVMLIIILIVIIFL